MAGNASGISRGGTGQTTAPGARIALGLEIGVDVQAHDTGLDALAAFNTNGFVVQTANNTFVGRSLTAPAAGITITNPAGTAGNPVFALANDLSALEGLASTGIAVRTAADTWVVRTITGTVAEITLTNGDGVAGNPVISLPAALTFTGKTITGGTYASGAFNGTVGATTPSTGVFTGLSMSGAGGFSVTTTGLANNVTFTMTDPGATGSIMVQYHNSVSPANNDVITFHQRDGNSSTGVTRVMASDFVTVTDVTNGSEDSTWTFQNIVNGAAVTQMNMTATGMQIPAIGATTSGTGSFTTLNSTGGALNGTLGATTPGTAIIVGVSTNSNAAAGQVGEVISSSIPSASFVTLTSNVAKDVTTISLTAGDWDVYGAIYFFPNAATNITYLLGSLSQTTNTNDTTEGRFAASQLPAGTVFASAFRASLQIADRFSLASTTSVFLVAMSTFTVNSQTAYGKIWARRAR